MKQVITYSDEFGLEFFTYDSDEEALAGYERLKAALQDHFEEDQIERVVILVEDCWRIE